MCQLLFTSFNPPCKPGTLTSQVRTLRLREDAPCPDWATGERQSLDGNKDRETTRPPSTSPPRVTLPPPLPPKPVTLAAEQWSRPSGLGQQEVTVSLPHFLSSAQVISSGVIFYCNCTQGRRTASGIFQRPTQTHNLKVLESSIEVVLWGKSSSRKNQSEDWVDAFSLRLKK